MSSREIEEEEREEREREKVERRIRLMELKMKQLKFCNIKNENKLSSCSICFEEFNDDAIVRETSCKHLFHNYCLMEWIKRKIDAPDCPYCRQEISL